MGGRESTRRDKAPKNGTKSSLASTTRREDGVVTHVRRAPPPRNHWSSSWRFRSRKSSGAEKEMGAGSCTRMCVYSGFCCPAPLGQEENLISTSSGDLPPNAAGRTATGPCECRKQTHAAKGGGFPARTGGWIESARKGKRRGRQRPESSFPAA